MSLGLVCDFCSTRIARNGCPKNSETALDSRVRIGAGTGGADHPFGGGRVYTAGQAKRGAEVYAAECASGHGSDLSGGESAPPLAGADFLGNWTVRRWASSLTARRNPCSPKEKRTGEAD